MLGVHRLCRRNIVVMHKRYRRIAKRCAKVRAYLNGRVHGIF